MIMTIPEAEIPMPIGLAPEGHRTFSYAEIQPGLDYYLTTIAVDEDGLELHRTFLLTEISQVCDLVSQYAIAINSIQRMTFDQLAGLSFTLDSAIGVRKSGENWHLTFSTGPDILTDDQPDALWLDVWPIWH